MISGPGCQRMGRKTGRDFDLEDEAIDSHVSSTSVSTAHHSLLWVQLLEGLQAQSQKSHGR